MSSNRKSRKLQNSSEETSLLFFFLLLILFYPPLVRGLFFSKELLVTHIFTSALFMAVIYFKPGYRAMKILGNPMDYAALGLLLIYIISSFDAAVSRDAVKEVLKIVNYIMVYYLVSYFANFGVNIRRMFEVIYASGFLVAVIGIFSIVGLNAGEGVLYDRISSTMQYPNTLASYLLAVFLIGLYLFPRQKNNYMTYLVCAGIYLVFLTFLWTKSRGGYLFLPIPVILLLFGISEHRKSTVFQLIQSVLIAIAVYGFANGTLSSGVKFIFIIAGLVSSVLVYILTNKFVSSDKKVNIRRWQYGIIIALALVGCGIILVATPVGEKMLQAFSRIVTTSTQERSIQERFIFYKDALKVFKESPIIGHGGGGWAGSYQKFQTYAYQSREVHNHYLQLLIETGIIGLIIYISLWIAFISNMIKNHKTFTAEHKAVNWIAFTVAVSIALNSLVDFNLTFGAMSILLWSMFGIVRGLYLYSNEEATKQKNLISTENGIAKVVSLSIAALILIFSFSLTIGLNKGEEGLSQYNNNRYDDAEKSLSSAVKYDPLNGTFKRALADILSSKGLALEDKEILKDALSYAENAVELEPYNPEVHIIKGNAYLRAEKIAEAVNEFETAVSLAPTNQRYYNQLAGVLLKAGKYYAYLGQKDKAAEYLRKVMDVPKMLEEKAKEIPYSEDMPWIKDQYNLRVDNKDMKKTLQEAQDALGQL